MITDHNLIKLLVRFGVSYYRRLIQCFYHVQFYFVELFADTSVEEHTKVSLAIRQDQIALVGIAVDNGSRPMKFLQRVVKSILRQMNVQVVLYFFG